MSQLNMGTRSDANLTGYFGSPQELPESLMELCGFMALILALEIKPPAWQVVKHWGSDPRERAAQESTSLELPSLPCHHHPYKRGSSYGQ